MIEDPNTYIEFSVTEGILYATYRAGVVIDEAAARNIVDYRKKISNGVNYPVVIFIEGILQVTASARRFMSSAEAIDGLVAAAIVSQSTVQYVLSNFFMQVNRINLPVRFFDRRMRAEKWIRQFA